MPLTHQAASEELARGDKIIRGLVARHGLMKIGAAPPASKRFESLANAIASQQLNGRAAASIWARVKGLVDGPFTAEAVRTVPVRQLREAGLSGAKCASLLDLADQVSDGRVRLDRIGRLTDDEVVDHLVGVRGIGPWTAQMFLMFTLRRLDVWPSGDYGVRNGYGRAFNGGVMPTAREIAPLGDRFAPYRSVAAWYCWAAADDPEYR
ncbi:MAG: DNA-3-methyladenine glycosylase 2 family protein [Actinobacteria bacterium]|nr:DNA-3-methyladenine glycosylase 2 family protein [Actinomycetota bacterium]